ncbi:E3 ubiquitin-protein ligase RNF213-like [Watersipora subatra]|uniref:E3 ubiquitin-protein ligase RNF213-like n=1 Tax=Watersipora subatra TaxID=2589382 RepID=UPI00355BC448
MIEKLKKAGLGYNVSEEETIDKFGKIPMRHLVYRVQALPQSLLPLVWDFGTLQSEGSTSPVDSVEGAYIKQMIIKFNSASEDGNIRFDHQTQQLAELLSISQQFMRKQKDECSFVSLRDIQRFLDVASWFYTKKRQLFPAMDKLLESDPILIIAGGTGDALPTYHKPTDVVRSILLAVGVSYLARLEPFTRRAYMKTISGKIRQLMGSYIVDGTKCLSQQVSLCQDLFANEVVDPEQHKNIAKNKALKENVFMMIVCIETRIPLFVIGKPGSSKSLSKSMVLDAMKGDASKRDLFRTMKNTYLVSFQCSRHATPSGIVNVFKECASFQDRQDLDKFVSVVVLDEVGLAEDSTNMPLKALHPLLEDGCIGNEKPAAYKKCAFIGISNWALDPAKMNRGIFIQIGSLDDNELEVIARGICRSSTETCGNAEQFIGNLAKSFQQICKAKKPEGRDLTEFFGLRDFYSLMKMVVSFARQTGVLNKNQLEHSIKRNFGGFDPDDEEFKPMDLFLRNCPTFGSLLPSDDGEPATDSIGLIQAGLFGTDSMADSRYLLILTENLSVLNVILDEFSGQDVQPEVVFGSRFSDDISYTQVCHNVYRIKMCMDMGRPVILLNLDDLYESLYEALNQYFSMWGNKKFVDLGLGTHRVKAYVHDSFRLVLIAEKSKVHLQFPIPLLNRLEKHYMSATSLLDKNQKDVKNRLELWMKKFCKPLKSFNQSCPMECEGCGVMLSIPYRLPCHHYIGDCCRERMFQQHSMNCPKEACEFVLDEEFQWTADKNALESRQYFENTSVSSSFIGYSSEMVSLVVKQTTDELFEEKRSYHKFFDEVFKKSKECLVECCTAESILRLDKTELSDEAKQVQTWYMDEQQHENLLQYLEQHMSQADQQSLLIQVTTFAELMNNEDITTLQKILYSQEESCDVHNLFLKDYPKESLFTDAARKFYSKQLTTDSKLLIIQCEAAHENIELLDSVRYIIQRETSSQHQNCHTILLLSLARGHPFSGYQGGKWKCVHIDDPRSPAFKLPSVSYCMQIQPRELIRRVLITMKNTSKNLSERDAEDMSLLPPLIDMDDCPDTELDVYGTDPARDVTTVASSMEAEDVLMFLEYCLPGAFSIITSAPSSNRATTLRSLLKDEEFCKEFLTHVYNLLKEQDDMNMQTQWVKVDAAKASNMKKSETIRHALEDSLERAFRPALAAVIAFMDHQHNLQLLKGSKEVVKLWLDIFTKSDELGLNFESLTKGTTSKNPSSRLPKSYTVNEEGLRVFRDFEARFPFSWLVRDTVEQLITVTPNAAVLKDRQGRWLAEPFGETTIGKVLRELDEAAMKKFTIDYIHDFVYMTHPCSSLTEHEIVAQTLLFSMTNGDYSITRVHTANLNLLHQLQSLSAILSFDLESSKVEFGESNASFASKLTEQVSEALQLFQDASDSKARENLEVNEENPGPLEGSPVTCDENLDQVEEDHQVTLSAKMPHIGAIAMRQLIDAIWKAPLQSLLKHPEEWVGLVDQCKLLAEKLIDPSLCDLATDELVSCRAQWLRLELKKLYVEHVIMPSKVDDRLGTRPAQQILPFLNASGKVVCYQKEGFDGVVNSLRKIVGDRIRSLHKDCPKTCPGCEKAIGSPSKLPSCGHFLCSSCLKQLDFCPIRACNEEVPKNCSYTPEEDETIDEAKKKDFEEFRKGINNFFVHFVSKLVFLPGIFPDMDIVEWLMNRVTFRDRRREFSIFQVEDIVNPTPILRSFLVKLFLQYQESPSVSNYLDRLIQTWSEEESSSELVSKMAMIINCHKDIHGNSLQQFSVQKLQRFFSEISGYYLKLCSDPTKASLLALTSIGDIQCALIRALEEIIYSQPNKAEMLHMLKDFLTAEQLKDNIQPRYFVIRQMLSLQGDSYVKDLINTKNNFLVPRDVQEALFSFSVPDVFLLFGGEQYQSALQSIDSIIAAEDDHLEEAVQEFVEMCQGNVATVLHTVFSRVTRSHAATVPVSEDVTKKMSQVLSAQFESSNVKQMLNVILDGQGLPPEMAVNQSKGTHLSMLVIHLFTSLVSCSKSDDLYPLQEIISQPGQAQAHFFPTMKDNIIEMMIKQHHSIVRHEHDALKPFRCACGEIYLIGECGRPVPGGDKCQACKSRIGGTNYNVLASNNTRLTDKDVETKTGHILGHAANRTVISNRERELSGLSCAVLRCFSHLALFVSALVNKQQMMLIINPALSCLEEVAPFLEAHIQIDLQQISECCGENIDNCILLLHDVINRMREGISLWDNLQPAGCILTTIKDRRDWEAVFQRKYINPTFSDQERLLQTLKQRIGTKSPRELAEIVSTTKVPIDRVNLLASAGLWEYVKPLTAVSVLNNINISGKELPVLTATVTNCDVLVAVNSLPEVIHLIKILSSKFHGRFTRAQAKEIKIGSFIVRHTKTLNIPEERLEKMVRSYVKAWNTAITSSNWNNAAGVLSEDPPLSTFLVDRHNQQVSHSLKLVRFLVETHNAVVQAASYEREPVSLSDVTPSRLVSLTSRDEIFSIITAYTEFSSATTNDLLYDWDGAEHEVKVKFVGTRSRIVFKDSELSCYMFQEDFSLRNQIEVLKPAQEKLDNQIRDITANAASNQSIQSLTNNLNALGIAINYLSVMPRYDKEVSLTDFMQNTVGSSLPCLPAGIKVRHTVDVWLLVKYCQTDALMQNNQEPFDDVEAAYTRDLQPEIEDFVREKCTYNSPRTKALLQQLFAYIIFSLNKEAVEQDYVDPEEGCCEGIACCQNLEMHLEKVYYCRRNELTFQLSC